MSRVAAIIVCFHPDGEQLSRLVTAVALGPRCVAAAHSGRQLRLESLSFRFVSFSPYARVHERIAVRHGPGVVTLVLNCGDAVRFATFSARA